MLNTCASGHLTGGAGALKLTKAEAHTTGIIASMTNPNFTAEQKQVHVALSAFVSSMVHSTTIKDVVVNLPVVTSEEALNEPRKYRPGPDRAPVAPLDLSM